MRDALLESQGCMIGAYDVLLAGHARSTGLTLVTANTAEFSRVRGLKLEDWHLTAP
jgi:tRNA(fMet)-specific endonuclease VapC